MVEICRGIFAREAVRRRTFGSVDDLKAAIAQCPDDGNDRRQPRVDQDRRPATRTLPPEQETSFAPHGARAGLMDGGDSRTDDTLPRPGCQTISGSARHATWHWRTTEGAN